MNQIASEPHAWSELPNTTLRNYLKRYGVKYSDTIQDVTLPPTSPPSTSSPTSPIPTFAPLPNCGNGVCEAGETVFNCPIDCKSYPETVLPAPSCE